MSKKPGRSRAKPSAGADELEHARNFLSSLFMGVRTAQIHDPKNKAFGSAVDAVHSAAETLYATGGEFKIQFVEDSAFLNGTRIRFEGGAFQSMRKLRRLLESETLGGVQISTPPSREAIQSLLLLFTEKSGGAAAISAADLEALQINLLGVQRFADANRAGLKIDRRIFALQSYAKLVLAAREQRQMMIDARSEGSSSSRHRPVRLRSVRVIQDLVELNQDRSDFLIRMAANQSGASTDEVVGPNSALLSISLGHALGLGRRAQVDLGMASLFHDIGRAVVEAPDTKGRAKAIQTAFARLLRAGGHRSNGHLRAVAVAEHQSAPTEAYAWGPKKEEPHLLARIVGVTSAYCRQTVGVGAEPLHPLEVLERLREDRAARLDQRIVDALINLLRAYPKGADVVLDDGRTAEVVECRAEARWDRPIVELPGGERLDLMDQQGERFTHRIVSTTSFTDASLPIRRVLAAATLVADPARVLPKDEAPIAPPAHPDGPTTAEVEAFVPEPKPSVAPTEDIRSPEPPGEAPARVSFRDRRVELVVGSDLEATHDSAPPPPTVDIRVTEPPDTSSEATTPRPELDDAENIFGMDQTTPSASLGDSADPDAATPRPEILEAPEAATPPPDLEPTTPRPNLVAPEIPVIRARHGVSQRDRITDRIRDDLGPAVIPSELEDPSDSKIPTEMVGLDDLAPVTEQAILPVRGAAPTPSVTDAPRERETVAFGYNLLGAGVPKASHVEHRATDPEDRTPVLIKIFDPSREDVSEADLALFENEGVIASSLSHPTLPHLVDAGRATDGRRFIVFERMDERTLHDWIEAGEITVRLVRTVTRALAEGLGHAHRRGVIISALDPDAITLDDSLLPRITDLGVATQKGKAHPRLANRFTPLPPEVAQTGQVDERTDQFLLGELMYELFTGRRPFLPGQETAEGAKPPDEGLDPVLSEVVMKLLAPDPDGRFKSCEAVAELLSRASMIRRRAR